MNFICISVWVTLLIVAVYAALIVRYCNRVVEGVTVLQCTNVSFKTELLDERQPIVCARFNGTHTFRLLKSEPGRVRHIPVDQAYEGLQHLCPWMCSPVPLREIPLQPPNSGPKYTRNKCMVCLLVQVSGHVSVWLVHPDHQSRTSPRYTEIVLREGNALFIPYKWWYAVFDRAHTGAGQSMPRSVQFCWEPWLDVCV